MRATDQIRALSGRHWIVGGTGRYAGASGTLKVHARDAAHSAYDFAVALK